MKVAIIGVGKMGRWFANFFLQAGIPVVVSDKDTQRLLEIRDELRVEIADNEDAVRAANIVIVCVPVEHFESVMKEIRTFVRPYHRIVDICTVKKFPVEMMHRHIKTGITLGAHPLFSPLVKNLKYQNIILTPTNSKEELFAKDFKGWLESQQAKVFMMSPEKHDKFMDVIFRLPRVAAFALWHTNKKVPSVLSLVYHVLAYT